MKAKPDHTALYCGTVYTARSRKSTVMLLSPISTNINQKLSSVFIFN